MNLSDLVPSLQRAVAVPGTFATLFPSTTDDDLSGTLADAVAEAQLDGFLSTVVVDLDSGDFAVDLTRPEQALVILYAMSRVVMARVANTKNRTRYKAGPVEAEEEQSATVLTELLRQIRDKKKELLDAAKAGNIATAFAIVDLYVAKSLDSNSVDVDLGWGW